MEVAVAQMRGKGKVGDPPACSFSSLPDPPCYTLCSHLPLGPPLPSFQRNPRVSGPGWGEASLCAAGGQVAPGLGLNSAGQGGDLGFRP